MRFYDLVIFMKLELAMRNLTCAYLACANLACRDLPGTDKS